MTVAATTNRKTYTGDNVTTSFATSPVIFYATSDLQVRVTVIATGVSTLLTLNTHYTVSGGSSAGAVGTVSLAGGSSPHGALLSTEKLVILRVLPLTQGVDLVNNNNSDAEVLEAALDKLTDVDQQLSERQDRALTFPEGDVSGSTTALPDAASRAGRVLGFDALGVLAVLVAQAGTSLVSLAASAGASLIGWIQAGVGAVLRTIQDKLREVEVNVKDYGAVWDGVTDDAPACQLALNAIPAAGGRVIFPPGTGKLNSTLTIPDRPVKLLGSGGGGLDVTTLVFGVAVTNGFVANQSSISSALEIGNMVIKTKAAGLGTAIIASWPVQASGIRRTGYFHDLEITFDTVTTTYWTEGIRLTDAWNSLVERCTIILRPPVGQSFAATTNAISLLGNSTSTRVSNCLLFHSSHGVDVGGTTQGVIIEDNVALSHDINFNLSTAAGQPGTRVSGNDTASYSTGLVLGKRYQVAVTDNIFYQDGGSTNNAWIGVNADSVAKQNVIANNTIGGAIGFAVSSFGVNIQGGDDSRVTGNFIQGVTFGINVAAAASLTKVGLNTFDQCTVNLFNQSTTSTITDPIRVTQPVVLAYSASMTADARLGVDFVITATNNTAFTINAPTNVSNGQHISFMLKNTSGGALGAATWNAVFKMSAWTNPANATSRTIEFRYDGTNWIQVAQTGVDVPN